MAAIVKLPQEVGALKFAGKGVTSPEHSLDKRMQSNGRWKWNEISTVALIQNLQTQNP